MLQAYQTLKMPALLFLTLASLINIRCILSLSYFQHIYLYLSVHKHKHKHYIFWDMFKTWSEFIKIVNFGAFTSSLSFYFPSFIVSILCYSLFTPFLYLFASASIQLLLRLSLTCIFDIILLMFFIKAKSNKN